MSFFASLDRRRILSVVLALGIALGSGFVMQSILVDDTPYAIRDSRPEAVPEMKSDERTKPLPIPPAATLVPILTPPPVMPDRVHPDRGQQETQLAPTTGNPCAASVSLDPGPAAMITVTARYPCATQSTARILHEGLEVTVATDETGVVRLELPALTPEATVTVIVDDHAVSAVAEVPDAVEYERVAMLWRGPQSLAMHAFEFGADRSQFGHVWSGSPKSIERAIRGSGGFLVTLGDGTGASAEVYSFPSGLSPLRGVVRLLVEAEVSDENCDQVVQARTLQTGALGVSETDVELRMPSCDATGEIVRLQNLLQDMRLAGR